MNCSVCYEWCPKHKDAIRTYDKRALCKFLNRETDADFCCDHGSIIPPENKKKSMTKAQIVRERDDAIQAKLDFDSDEVKSAVLYDHQKEALEKFKDKDDIALFFEMGCGKTITCLKIAEYKFKKGEIDSLLVIAPNDVHKQWYTDLVHPTKIKLLDIPFEAQCIGGRGGGKALVPFDDPKSLHIVTVNVDTFSTPHKWEPIVEWSNANKCMIAVDEATIIKNPTSKRAQRILYEFNHVTKRGKTIVKSEKINPVRAVLTGTPVTNGPMDLWAIMEFLHPNYFNRNYYSFREHYGMFTKLSVTSSYGSIREVPVLLTEKTWRGIHDSASFTEAAITFGCSEDTYMTVKHQDSFVGPYKHADELKQQIEPVSVFRKLVDCVDMPKTIYINREVGMNEAQKACYNNMKEQMIAQYEGYEATASNKLVVNMRLQQISSGFIMGSKSAEGFDASVFEFEGDLDSIDVMPNEVVWLGDTNPKLDALMRDIDEADKPILILTRYTAEASKIFDLCSEKYSTCLITGWKTVGSIDEFKQGKYDIMVANSSKIARGFNLQNSHTTLFYSNTFSMETRQQAEFRTFRIGQTHPCTYIDYVSSDADRVITKALQMKKNLLEYIREQDLNISEVI